MSQADQKRKEEVQIASPFGRAFIRTVWWPLGGRLFIRGPWSLHRIVKYYENGRVTRRMVVTELGLSSPCSNRRASQHAQHIIRKEKMMYSPLKKSIQFFLDAAYAGRSKKTRKDAWSIFYRHITPVLKETDISRLTTADISSVLRQWKKPSATKLKIGVVLRRTIKAARDAGQLNSTPWEDLIQACRVPGGLPSRWHAKRRRTLSRSLLDRGDLLKKLRLVDRLFVGLGCKLGFHDAAALRRNDLLENGKLRIDETLRDGRFVSCEERLVRIPLAVHKELARVFATSQTSSFLFRSKRGKPLNYDNFLKRNVASVFKKNGYDGPVSFNILEPLVDTMWPDWRFLE